MSEEKFEKNQKEEPGVGFYLIVVALSIPTSMIIGRWMPEFILPIGDGFSLHGILSGLCAYFLLHLILYPFRSIINVIGIAGLILTLFLFWKGDLTKEEFISLFDKGTSAITQNEIMGRSMSNEVGIRKALKDDAGLDEFVESKSNENNHLSLIDPTIVKSFDVFRELSQPNWHYINDPPNRELFRPVRETIKTHSGDCDDYAICLAACMKHCGACARIVSTRGHLYPQLYVGHPKDKEKIEQAIRMMFPTARNRKIHFSADADKLWLNMDYSAPHPGGEFKSDVDFETLELCD